MNALNPPSARPAGPLSRRLHWPMVIGLALFALIRPIFSIAGWSEVLGKPATPLILTAVISVVWIAVVGFSRVREPLLQLLATGICYAIASTLLAAVLSPVLEGELQGPITNPIALVMVCLTNVVWGGLCGVCAWGLQRRRGVRS
ncbi:hypothetical protein GCM10010377_76630 [Streptomyces viridiviolaceus]|uniref:Integral membrane protein n=1 Tax=Streptomyces viridiviolaceus TaxID=68282 RepID=A0ABW2E9S3_9ACTN|nr:hypothetical protein [Streptomyces viridiviolaceus]GHB74844.1 hypothetical protein GCM10010377_76630 [Streptomyces viridiviolaceus]